MFFKIQPYQTSLNACLVVALGVMLQGTCYTGEAPEDCLPPGPGGTREDRYMAFFEPDEYAWKLFLAISKQADPARPGYPDPAKPELNQYDDDKDVVWESWALSSGGRSGGFRRSVPNRSEIFLDKGAPPPPWGTWKRGTKPKEHLEFFQGEDPHSTPKSPLKAQKLQKALRPGMQILISDTVRGGEQLGEEVRMNICGYNFVLEKKLYSVEGIEAMVTIALDPRNTQPGLIQFPNGAQEVKAKWIPISENDKPRYHWRSIAVPGEEGANPEVQTWGMVGLHITTKDLPNWFWCSFEHVDTESHAEIPSRDATTTRTGGQRPETTAGNPQSKWQYYRLRGTQIDFTNAFGPVILANTQIEHGFQMSSSCMTCHSRASAGLRRHRPDLNQFQPNTLPVFTPQFEDGKIRFGPIGAPNPNWFRADESRLRYIQTDFVWVLPFRANSVNETPPTKPIVP